MMWEDKNDYMIYKKILDNFTALNYFVAKGRKKFWRKYQMFSSVLSQETEVSEQFLYT